MAPRAANESSSTTNIQKSPFFAPNKSRGRKSSTPDEAEHKSSIAGCASNLINAIVGAGIVGIPFAMKSMGLVSGIIMLIIAAALTEKSLRLLIETAKHIDVPSYETLCEATFGKPGFLFVSCSMFIIAYGAMVSYLIIIKDLLSSIIGFDEQEEVAKKQLVLIASSALVVLPLSMQRDMADLAKTSRISVLFDCLMVLLLALFSPISSSVQSNGGFSTVLKSSVIRPPTFFQGLGVVSFAFVCQHSAFIIATSLKQPTKPRWSKVTSYALTTCATLAMVCGMSGYLAFLDNTEGNILNSFGSVSSTENPNTHYAALLARILICTTMFFVYPMECFVARHVCVVLLFKGRQAHEGDDHAVLARTDRRIILTLALYAATLIPALLVEDLGVVMALTGSVGGSCLSYIGPGVIYIAVHGAAFLDLVDARFHSNDDNNTSGITKVMNGILYYVLMLPLWCTIASTGDYMLMKHEEEEALKSPHVSRLGKVIHHHPITHHHHQRGNVQLVKSGIPSGAQQQHHHSYSQVKHNDIDKEEEDDDMESGEKRYQPLVKHGSFGYGSIQNNINNKPTNIHNSTGLNIPVKSIESHGGNRAIALAIANANRTKEAQTNNDEEEVVEDDPQDDSPTMYDFLIAIGFVIFGIVAMSAGIFSIFVHA